MNRSSAARGGARVLSQGAASSSRLPGAAASPTPTWPLRARASSGLSRSAAPCPDIALSLNNLAAIDHARGDFDQARRRFERALRIREETLGPEHSDVATSPHNLASH
ncbi:MAG: tetratricopeptide repeat protein [Nannocystis sp.]|nr:tetratricopeptide repeat protein [Nannocystis sp.]